MNSTRWIVVGLCVSGLMLAGGGAALLGLVPTLGLWGAVLMISIAGVIPAVLLGTVFSSRPARLLGVAFLVYEILLYASAAWLSDPGGTPGSL